MKRYLKKVNLETYSGEWELAKQNKIVTHAFRENKNSFSAAEISKLYCYYVPKLGPNGSCSITHEIEDQPYNLSHAFGLQFDTDILKNHQFTLLLWRLNCLVKNLKQSTGVDWLGIYKKIIKPDGKAVLLKLAYQGRLSRAEFPLTKKFAKNSNNATVGLTGKAVLFQNIDNYAGPYYECDSDVVSELCCPIINKEKEVIGILDAESFYKNFFNAEKILTLAKVCFDLGKLKLI